MALCSHGFEILILNELHRCCLQQWGFMVSLRKITVVLTKAWIVYYTYVISYLSRKAIVQIPQNSYRSLMATSGKQFFSTNMWILGIKLRLSYLTARSFT